ncbi:MAG TPA: AAA family ATPase, partial [Aggregatilineales bacterium]|nr:AAA family ATPase [Aggregatilineales bacterium]
MLEELRIRNFAIIEALELEFDKGLNVITGETGAGKSIIVDAVELILGGKVDVSMVRAGAEKATIEGVFSLESPAKTNILDLLKRQELTDDADSEFITLSRDLRSNGRSTARVNGITVSQEILRSVGDLLVDIHGQSEHLTLFNPPHHLDLLDRYADLMEMREALRTVTEHVYEVRRDIRGLLEDEAVMQRRLEMLRHAVEEIDAAELKPNEDEDLKKERNRFANSEQIAKLSAEAGVLLSGADDARTMQISAVDALARVSVLLEKLATLDPALNELATQ